jgi:hypothetical protein
VNHLSIIQGKTYFFIVQCHTAKKSTDTRVAWGNNSARG